MQRTRIGTLEELKAKGCLTGKLGSLPICVFWSNDQAYAVDDRCPHMGFPLHRGSVEDGLLTCHWHHARFDLESGGTLDPFADDVRAHPVEIVGDEVFVVASDVADAAEHHLDRLAEGLEQGLTLVLAKAVLALFAILGPEKGAAAAVGAGVDFGVRNRGAGWGTGLTVLTAMANVLESLEEEDRSLALVHGLVFVANDTRGRPPRFALTPLSSAISDRRLESWYRRFVDTRNGDAAERVRATAVASGLKAPAMAALMGAAATDHVFVDEGHTIDFTNKAFEVLEHLGYEHAGAILPTLAQETADASRSEETGSWRHPEDLARLLQESTGYRVGAERDEGERTFEGGTAVDELAWLVLGDDPAAIVDALDRALSDGATPEELARAVAYAAGLRLTRFHVQNDHADWNVVHHGFTSANAVHQLVVRAPTPALVRGVYHGAMKVYLDRFLNVPAARLPGTHALSTTRPELGDLQQCWDHEGMVDEAGALVYGWLDSGGDPQALVGALGRALLAEDSGFHWYQTFEATVRQLGAWPAGSEQGALLLVGAARFLAAHTPTRRELPQVVRIAARLRRGEALYEEV